MTPTDYILTNIKSLSEPIIKQDYSKTTLEEAIFARVTSKKFRKLKPADLAVKLTKQAITLAVKNNKPLRIVNMFGGNKLWRFEEAPEIDWAELFSLIYFLKWSRLIAGVYEPGVTYEYFSQDISVESLNNVPKSETDKYSQSFRQLIEFINPLLPTNLKVKYVRHYELFADPHKYHSELETAKEEILKNNKGRLPEMTDAMKKATELNVRLKPGQENDPLWREKVELEHQAIFKTVTLRKYADEKNIIWTCPTYYEDCIVTGSTKRSIAKFWAAVGVLRKEGNSYADLVLTPKQLETAQYRWEDINIPGLKGKNFNRIRILE